MLKKIENERNDVVHKCNYLIEGNENFQNNDYHALLKKMANQIGERAKTIKEICDKQKYDLYFCGYVGTGKSTFISTMFNLIDDALLQEDNRFSKALLLETAQGKTTICETQIYPNVVPDTDTNAETFENSVITIDPVSEEKFNEILKNYHYKLNFKGDSNDKIEFISTEEERLLKNMLDIKTDDDIKDFTLEQLKAKINYGERTKVTFEFTDGNFKQWLKLNYSNLNFGKLKEAPMPKKITIKIAKKDLEFDIPSYINSISDTRGLDLNNINEIEENIHKKNSITFICDKIHDVGKVLELFKTILIPQDVDDYLRTYFIGMEHGNQLEDIPDTDNDRQKGTTQKTNEILDNISAYKINPKLKENIVFCKSAPGIRISESEIIKLDSKAFKDGQTQFFDFMTGKLSNMYSTYISELNEKTTFFDLLKQHTVNDELKSKFCKSQEKLVDIINNIDKQQQKPILKDRFIGDIRNASPSGIDKAIRENGYGKTVNFYTSISTTSAEEFEDVCREERSIFIDFITTTFKYKSESDLEFICFNYINENCDILYKYYIQSCKKSATSNLSDKWNHYPIWSEARELYGSGRGYRERAISSIESNWVSYQVQINNVDFVKRYFERVKTFLI